MLRLADYIEYKPTKIYDQGTLPQCSAFAYLAALTENIEQEFGVLVEFDIKKEYDRMIKSGIEKTFIERFGDIGRKDGFKSIDGKYLVKVEAIVKIKPLDFTREFLQAKGTLVWIAWIYKGYSLTKADKNAVLIPLSTSTKRSARTHAMFIAGYDKDRGYKFYNSWGKNSTPRYVDVKTFEILTKGLCVYYFDLISLIKL